MEKSVIIYSIVLAVFIYLVVELVRARNKVKKLGRLDPLTGVANRNAFYDIAGTELKRNKRYKHPFTVAYIDIDNLKMVNYRLGHSAGDNLLNSVAAAIKKDIRDVDLVSRFGGDEFAVLLPETSAESAQVVLSRLRNRLLELMKKRDLPTTFSFGAMTFTAPPDSVEDMVKKAGSMMYSAKNSGTNMIDQDVFDGRN